MNQAQLAELIALREGGRGPDWQCVAQGEYNWRDQRLMLKVLTKETEQAKLCEGFLEWLLMEEQQTKLSGIGAFPVTGVSAYGDFSAYRIMERQMLASKPLFPKSEHSPESAAALVRKLSSGQISAAEAIGILAQT